MIDVSAGQPPIVRNLTSTNVRFCIWGSIILVAHAGWGTRGWHATLIWGVLVDGKSSMSQRHILVSKRAPITTLQAA